MKRTRSRTQNRRSRSARRTTRGGGLFKRRRGSKSKSHKASKRKVSKRKASKGKKVRKSKKQKGAGCGCGGVIQSGGNKGSIYGSGVYWPKDLARPF
jgi:hypothetical protein